MFHGIATKEYLSTYVRYCINTAEHFHHPINILNVARKFNAVQILG